MSPAGSLLLAVIATLAVVLFCGVLAAAIWLGLSQGRGSRRKLPEAHQEPHWAARVAALEVKVDALPGLWGEERKRAEQARDRERYYATKRARRSAEEDSEGPPDEELPGGNAPAGDVQGVLPLSGSMGPGPGIPEPEYITRARQMGYPWSFLS